MPVNFKKTITVEADMISVLETIKQYVAANDPANYQAIESKTVDDIINVEADGMKAWLVVEFKKQDGV